MSAAFDILCDSGDRAPWLKARKSGLGASDSACVMGCGWKSPAELWEQKRGLFEGDDLDGVEMVHWGNVLESIIAEQYATKRYAGRPVEMAGELLRSTRHPFMMATLDAWTDHPVHGRIPLEVKTVSAYRAEDWLEGPPEQYEWQLHQQMLVTGAPAASIACLIGGQQLVWCDMERDEFKLGRLVSKCTTFWDLVLNSEMPPEDPTHGGHLVLSRLFPRQEDGKEVALPGEYLMHAEALADAKAEIKAAEAKKRAAENAIRAEMKDAESGVLPDGSRFTLKQQTRKAMTIEETSFRVLRFKESKK